ncbi:MAG: bifunctional folylpolyglutamate synthase/dihydrofolate synthase [Prevotella sp.]|jgi:dihydrofolate synthase/folylpolyglutamate synthase|nr:bifunctional folylpolyglutamate synthase/dihydrofolate synthase [Prevotella sp.]
MTYKEVIDYLYSQVPSFEKQGLTGYKEGLGNTLKIDEHFEHPHESFRCIHVAGTNGKGSVSHSIAALLQVFGYRVGLYTSPHLVDFRERIRVNGIPVSEDYVVNFVERNRSFFEPLNPSFFEITTALAFSYFKEADVDIAVIEVGLGGRLDCTNVITPILSIITNISLDHTQLLGDSLEQIAMEKAGIIKPNVPVVIGESLPETRPVFEAVAEEKHSPIYFADDDEERVILSAEPLPQGGMHYHTNHINDFEGELSGIYQEKNTNTVMCAMHRLEEKGYVCMTTPDNLEKIQGEMNLAFQHVCEMTGLMGRWQTIRTQPTVVCDTGHNVAGWEYISRQLANVKCRQMHIIYGAVDDKDIYGIMNLLPKDATYYYTKADTKRAFPETSLKVFGDQFGLQGECYPTVLQAYQKAMSEAHPDDFVFVGGSTYVVADLLKSLN